jgi:hypothetical protein
MGRLMGLLDDGEEYLRRSGRNFGGLLDWLAGGARAGAEPTMALMRGDALGEPLLPTATSGGRIGAIASALTQPMVPGAAPAGALGVYGGRMAKTANLDKLAEAERLVASGADNEAVRAATGWFRGPEHQWRFEIPDNDAKLQFPSMDSMKQWAQSGEMSGKVGDYLNHPQLFDAYPALRDVDLSIDRGREPTGMYRHSLNRVDMTAPADFGTSSQSVLLHELQHGIQDRENFSQGGNKVTAAREFPEAARAEAEAFRAQRAARTAGYDEFLSDILEETDSLAARQQYADYLKERTGDLSARDWDDIGSKLYRRLAGEVEARDVQARMNLTPQQRAAQAPYSSQGILPDQMLIRRGLLD